MVLVVIGLIIGALMTFLVKVGAGHRRRDIHLGVGAAVVLSVLTAVAIETVFRISPARQELLEGITMLLAVVVLFYVSYWLLSKMEVGKWTVEYDPTRQVNIASGGNFFPVGHIVDHHEYPHPRFPFDLGEGGRFDDFVKIIGEFGGHGFPVQGHLWDPNARNWGYGDLPKSKEEWLERYRESIRRLAELRKQGIAAGIYTQTTDVEGEINGLLTYDRQFKFDPAAVKALNDQLR